MEMDQTHAVWPRSSFRLVLLALLLCLRACPLTPDSRHSLVSLPFPQNCDLTRCCAHEVGPLCFLLGPSECGAWRGCGTGAWKTSSGTQFRLSLYFWLGDLEQG